MIIIANQIGIDIENAIRNKILSNVPPPNDPSTIKAKGSSHTLIDSGTLLDSISHIVEYDPELITICSGIMDEDEEISKYACFNEYGTLHIPERSFIRSTFDEIFDNELMENFTNNMEEFTKQKLGK